jgi:hypothetical protein
VLAEKVDSDWAVVGVQGCDSCSRTHAFNSLTPRL